MYGSERGGNIFCINTESNEPHLNGQHNANDHWFGLIELMSAQVSSKDKTKSRNEAFFLYFCPPESPEELS